MIAAPEAVWLAVQDAGAVGAVRRAAVALGDSLGLLPPRVADLAIVASEMASNLYKHTTDGIALVQPVRRGGVGGVELVAIDKGPGMHDLRASVVDGQSTTGTLGIGLGSIRRQSSEYDAYSWPGSGTVIAATVWPSGAVPPDLPGFVARGVVRPMSGEEVSGDGYGIRTTAAGDLQVMLCDGLGHGPLAAAAAQAAEAGFRDAPESGPKDVLDHIHRRLNHTRGAVMTVVELDRQRERLRFAGVGNVAGSIVDGQQRRMLLAQPGIAGHARPQVRELELPWPPGAVLVLHTDGVVDRWSLTDQPGLTERSPIVIAAAIMRDAAIRRDDAAVLVAKRAA